ncbi:hypothetical protein NQ318_023281 [Aromia moschata]|uniref:Uncharacterized protein n=1 Tax=Aromia moschata TaxID=1265417 RepID=A0AAV8Y5F5_9CUCU|nr:hypothetical protein NQ318_023281 [Aromia moschata]
MMNPVAVQKKIQEYDIFVEEKLKTDLKDIERILNNKVSKYKDWDDVKLVFKEKDSDMILRADIGKGIMVSGEVTDFESVYVLIGLGYMLEMDCDEADKYSDIRMKSLTASPVMGKFVPGKQPSSQSSASIPMSSACIRPLYLQQIVMQKILKASLN